MGLAGDSPLRTVRVHGCDRAFLDVGDRALLHARLEIFEQAGHFPHRADPVRFVEVVTSFIRATDGSRHDRTDWRALMVLGSA